MSIAMPSPGWGGPWMARARLSCGLAGLMQEEVHRVGRVVPQQVVRPAARLAEGVEVLPPEEIGLDVHLAQRQPAALDPLADPLVGGIEPPRVAGHRDEAGAGRGFGETLGVGEIVGHRDLDLHRLAGLQALDRLGGVEGRRRGQDDRVDVAPSQAQSSGGGWSSPGRMPKRAASACGRLGVGAYQQHHASASSIAASDSRCLAPRMRPRRPPRSSWTMSSRCPHAPLAVHGLDQTIVRRGKHRARLSH